VIGGGFIGSEIAAALALNGKEVVRIFPGEDIGDRVFPRPLAQFVSNFYKQKGVEVLAGEKIIGLETRGNQRVLKTGSNREIAVDGVVAGVGIEPNVELAQTAGLSVENGIIVDEFLRTNLQRYLRQANPIAVAAARRTLDRWHLYGGLIYFHLLLDRLSEGGFLPPEAAPPQTGAGNHSDTRQNIHKKASR
jgi:hypothetical protein